MKKLLTILFILFSFIGVAQVDTTRSLQLFNGYGMEYKNLAVNGYMRIPRDTFSLKYADSGSLAFKNGLIWIWFAGTWHRVGPVVPAGGTAGQVLVKQSSLDFDFKWVTPTSIITE